MYDHIKKPKLLKNIPMIYIRALPVLYYFSKYYQNHITGKPRQIYDSHVSYFINGLEILNNQIQDKELADIISIAAKLKSADASESSEILELATIKLSDFFNSHKITLQPVINEIKKSISELYKNDAKKISVLLVDNNNEPEKVNKLNSTLTNFCFYKVDQISSFSSVNTEKIIDSDIVFFSSIYPPEIHENIKKLHLFHKPGLASAFIEKNGLIDQQTIRHGSQLIKIGFHVLFKIFTPIRLFTSIDKVYMKFHLTH